MINGVVDPLDFSAFEDSLMRRHQQRQENLILRFFQQGVPNTMKSAEAGREICEIRDFVSIIVPGSKDEFIQEMDDAAKKRFGPQYERWKQTQEQPVDGQPLENVPWLNVAQIREMQYLNIKTLEQLAGLSDAAIQHIGMGGRELRTKAQSYIAAGKDSAEVSRMTTRISELERENARLQDSIKAVNARYEALIREHETVPVAGPSMAPAPAPQPPAGPAIDIAALIRAEVARALKPPEGE